jgi:hypothetical protein
MPCATIVNNTDIIYKVSIGRYVHIGTNSFEILLNEYLSYISTVSWCHSIVQHYQTTLFLCKNSLSPPRQREWTLIGQRLWRCFQWIFRHRLSFTISHFFCRVTKAKLDHKVMEALGDHRYVLYPFALLLKSSRSLERLHNRENFKKITPKMKISKTAVNVWVLGCESL